MKLRAVIAMPLKLLSKYHWLCMVMIVFSHSLMAENDLESAELLLHEGQYLAAKKQYQSLLIQAQQAKNATKVMVAMLGLGHSHYLLNQPDLARDYLNQTLNRADSHDYYFRAKTHYYLALVHAQLNDQEAYQWHSQEAKRSAQNFPLIQAFLELAAIKRSTTAFEFQKHVLNLETILAEQSFAATSAAVIHLTLAEYLIQNEFTSDASLQSKTQKAYYHLIKSEQTLGPEYKRARVKIAELKARLYVQNERYSEALKINSNALKQASASQYTDLQLVLEWQAARIFHRIQQIDSAIGSYRRAIHYLAAIRQDIPVYYQDGKSSYKTVFGPLYRGLADLLLGRASQVQGKAKQRLLFETQTLLEQIKQVELEDFFQNRCLTENSQMTAIDQIKDDSAVLYPVILDQRIEWLIGINGRLEQIQVFESKESISQLIRKFSSGLRRGVNSSDNEKLYQLLFKKLDQRLKQNQIKTLLYIPDGVMRLLPLAALSDGEKYLIEKYAIATLPGLNLLGATIARESEQKTLLSGLSQPGEEIVEQLPGTLIKEISGDDQFVVSALPSEGQSLTALEKGSDSRQLRMQQVLNSLALPGVVSEINQLSANYESKTLLDADFTLQAFQQQIAQPEYNIIHIASHGFFAQDSKGSFIMTYDQLLTLDRLEALLKSRAKDQPISLLTLSACQTAEGDDRAPLGLSGAAIKANAESALGSLWPISDEAAVELMTVFYQQLIEKGKGKAQALREAQLHLINHEELSHPFYWAPFILVGHWQ